MTINIPKQFMGIDVNGAMEKALDGNLAPIINNANTNSSMPVPEVKGKIYVPSAKLYFAKERSCLGKNWNNCHKELQNQGLKMPTIPQFIKFLKYLRDNVSAENTQIYKDITEVRDPWRSEWLDADFKVKGKELYVNYQHELKNGVLVPKYSEKLESCLMEDKTPGISLDAWLDSPTKNGFPKTNITSGKLYFWYPREDRVARFVANSGRADLLCYWGPGLSSSSLGVYACAEGAVAKNSGGIK